MGCVYSQYCYRSGKQVPQAMLWPAGRMLHVSDLNFLHIPCQRFVHFNEHRKKRRCMCKFCAI